MSQEPLTSDPVGPPDGGMHATCPQCDGAMAVAQVLPILFAPDVDDVVFRCEPCSIEISRSVRRR